MVSDFDRTQLCSTISEPIARSPIPSLKFQRNPRKPKNISLDFILIPTCHLTISYHFSYFSLHFEELLDFGHPYSRKIQCRQKNRRFYFLLRFILSAMIESLKFARKWVHLPSRDTGQWISWKFFNGLATADLFSFQGFLMLSSDLSVSARWNDSTGIYWILLESAWIYCQAI